MSDAQIRQHNAAIPLRGYKLGFMREDVAVEIPVDAYSDQAMSSMLLWTTVANRLRVKIGAGSYVAVGATRATAADLGAFSAGETKVCTIEVKVPVGADIRHEDLVLNVGVGY